MATNTTGTDSGGDGGAEDANNGDNGDNGDNVEEFVQEERESWSGRVSFWLAAVGSAVGLGNLWRFPWQCAKWGGGAFIFAYFVALFTLGMPLLTQELALGQKHRSGDIEAFGRMNWRLRGIGLASVIGGFGIVTYYMAVIGISTVFFFESFISPLPYKTDDLANGSAYLYDDVLKLEYGGIDQSNSVIAGKLYLATCLCWFITFLCIMKGVKTASWAVKITMPLPFLLLFILLIKAATLEGSWRGVKKYWDFSNWDYLSSSGIWNAAIGQCFFSLSVCMGVMTAYGSYNPIRQDIATDEKVIAFLDVGASLISGFVVYSVLGFLVVTTGDEEFFNKGGGSLAFDAAAVAIAQFEGANFFGIIFFLTLMLLGIDSAFSIVEAVSTVIADSDMNLYRLKWSRPKISAVLCMIGAFLSSLYCFDTGQYWLDIVDHYINNYGMIFLGIMETAAVGWFYRYDIIEAKIGAVSANLYRIGYFFALLMACLLSFSLATPEQKVAGGEYFFTGTLGQESWIVGFVVAMILWAVTIIICYFKRSDPTLPFGETMWYLMGWENVEVLRDFINCNGLGDEAWKAARHTLRGEGHAGIHHSSIGIWWGFLIKYWLPTVLTVVLIGQMRADRWNPPFGAPWGFLSVGILIFTAMVLTVVLVAIFPQWMTQKVDETGQYGNLDRQGYETEKAEEQTALIKTEDDKQEDDGNNTNVKEDVEIELAEKEDYKPKDIHEEEPPKYETADVKEEEQEKKEDDKPKDEEPEKTKDDEPEKTKEDEDKPTDTKKEEEEPPKYDAEDADKQKTDDKPEEYAD